MQRFWVGFLVVLMLGISTQGKANVIYSYEGNFFEEFFDQLAPSGTYDTTNRVTGFFEVASPLSANLPLTDISGSLLDYSFTDGEITRTFADSFGVGAFFFQVSTDGFGEIELWAIQLEDKAFTDLLVGEERRLINSLNSPTTVGQVRDTGFINRCTFVVGPNCTSGIGDLGRSLDSPGVWTISTVSVPEPASLALFAFGLAGLGFMTRRRRNRRRQN